MKLYTREEFLKLPANTVFSKYEPAFFEPLQIKGETCGEVDFYTQSIEDALEYFPNGGTHDDACMALEAGKEHPIGFNVEGREALFDGTEHNRPEIRFAVWDKKDIQTLIDALKECL